MLARPWSSVCAPDYNWGTIMVIEHTLPDNSKVCTIYGHVDVGANENDIVSINDPIGTVGDFYCPEGWTDHVHFGVYNGAFGTSVGSYPSWLHGYLPPGTWPGNYLKPDDFIASHLAVYHTVYVDQTPSDVVDMTFGETATFEIRFRNDGSDTWVNSGGFIPGNPSYVELWSTGSGGDAGESFLYHSPTWINRIRVGPMIESTVAPGQIATFRFTGQVPSSTSLGWHQVYFRPYHATAGMLDDWPGVHFVVNVINPPSSDSNLSFEYDADSNGDADNWLEWVDNGLINSYRSGGAPSFAGCNPYGGGGSHYARLVNDNSGERSILYHHNSGAWGNLFTANTWYRLVFRYRANTPFHVRFFQPGAVASGTLDKGLDVTDPIDDGGWHYFATPPFQLTSSELSTYSDFGFRLYLSHVGTIDIDNIEIVGAGSCYP
jgi:hypothetical protein